MRRGGANRPNDLRPVGKILSSPSPKINRASGGSTLKVTVDTWLTDVYRCSEWWIELPNIDDVESEVRRKIMIKACPLGAPTNASVVAVEDGAQGRMRMDDIKLVLFIGNSGDDVGNADVDHWGLISCTPPTWFANVWHARAGNGQLIDELKHAKVYVRRVWEQNEQRDWTDLRI